jgi:two-component system sensor histidine kinase/response regulator
MVLAFALFCCVVLVQPSRSASQAPVADFGHSSSELLSDTDRDWIAKHGAVRFGLPGVEWPPLDLFTAAGEYEGITADYLALLGARLGFSVEIVKFPSFGAALEALKQGNIDVMGSMARTPDRETFSLFTLPYIHSQPVIITRKDDRGIALLPDLAGKTVAIEKGFASREYLNDIPNISFAEFVGTKEALEAVSLGRASAYVGSLITTTYIMDRDALSNLEVRSAAGLPISELRFAVTRKLPELARLFDHGLASITEEENAAIRKKWIGTAGLVPDWGAILRIAIPVGGALISIILVILIWNQRLHRQVARRRQAEAALVTQMSFQMALLEHVPNLVAYKDAEARFVGCNRAYEQAFGVPRDRLVGKTTREVEEFPGEQRQRGYEEDMEMLRTNGVLHREDRLVFADGKSHDVLLWRIPFHLSDGSAVRRDSSPSP